MTRLGLTINEAKTSLKNARQERFDFLGYSFGPHRYKANGKWYLSASPSKKGVRRLKTKVSNLLLSGNNDPWPEVRDALNRSLLGWSNYFCHGTCRSAFRGIDRYVYERVRDFLARRHKMAGRGTKRFSRDVVYGARGLLRLERRPFNAPSWLCDENQSESRMPEIGTSGSMSGDGKRGVAEWPKLPRPSSTLPAWEHSGLPAAPSSVGGINNVG